MADKLPVKGVYDGGGNATGLSEFVTGDTIPLANGGTGATTQAGAANAVLPTQTGNAGLVLKTDGSNVSWGSAGGGIDYVNYTFASGL